MLHRATTLRANHLAASHEQAEAPIRTRSSSGGFDMRRREFVHDAMTAISAFGAAAALGCSKKTEESVATAASTPASAAPAVIGQNVSWRLVSSFPRSLDTIFSAAETLSERVAALSGNKFKITVHAAGEIVPGLEVLDAVQQGNVELAHTASYY